MSFAFSPPPRACLDVTETEFALRPVCCSGRNDLPPIHEMGTGERDAPVIFRKPRAEVKIRGEFRRAARSRRR